MILSELGNDARGVDDMPANVGLTEDEHARTAWLQNPAQLVRHFIHVIEEAAERLRRAPRSFGPPSAKGARAPELGIHLPLAAFCANHLPRSWKLEKTAPSHERELVRAHVVIAFAYGDDVNKVHR